MYSKTVIYITGYYYPEDCLFDFICNPHPCKANVHGYHKGHFPKVTVLSKVRMAIVMTLTTGIKCRFLYTSTRTHSDPCDHFAVFLLINT